MVFCLFCLAGSALAQAYRWTDANGVVHYSDRPEPGAEEFVLPDTAAPSAIIPPVRTNVPVFSSGEDDEDDTPAQFYQAISIISPAAEETLWNIQGNLTVQLSLRPNLSRGHQIRAYFDGTPRIVSGTTFNLSDVFRGSHNLQVEVIDRDGEMQIRSETIQFFVQQTSIAGGNNPGIGPR